MVVVGNISRAGPASFPVRRGAERAAFGVRAAGPGRAEATVPGAAVSMTSLLAMQEAGSDAEREREAREHGHQLVDELAELQLALLGGGEAGLERLTQLAARPVSAASPALAGVLRAIQLRAAVEVARRGGRG